MKNIPIALANHKALQVTTLCRLLKIRCKNGTMFGFANLDQDVTYDDDLGAGSPSDGPIVYRSANGFTPARLSTASGTSVDNTDLAGIVATLEALGITEEQVRSGLLDYADAWVYEVNYLDLTTGSHEIKARGKCGRLGMNGEGFRAEFRSLTQLMKQSLGAVTSITCRTEFGSTQCGKAFTWITSTIEDVDISEPDRVFTDSVLVQAAAYFVPGVVEILDGENMGKQIDVEDFAGGVVYLTEPLYFNLAPGVSYRIRQDCSKVWDDASHGCLYHWPAERALHFRGEPLIPLGQEGELATPGAEL